MAFQTHKSALTPQLTPGGQASVDKGMGEFSRQVVEFLAARQGLNALEWEIKSAEQSLERAKAVAKRLRDILETLRGEQPDDPPGGGQ